MRVKQQYKTRGGKMKKIGWHSRIAVALLLAVMMIFSVAAVTVFAATEDNGADVTTEYDTPWYTISYTAPEGTANAKLDIRVKTAYSKFLEITKEDASKLKDELIDVLYHLVIDCVFAEQSTTEQYSISTFALTESETETAPDLSHIDISELEEFIHAHLTGEDAKEKIEAILNSEFDTVIQLVVDKYVTEQGYSYADIETKINDLVEVIVPDIYVDEPELVDTMLSSVQNKISEVIKETEEIKESGGEISISLSDFKSIRGIIVNGEALFSDGSFRMAAIKSLLADIPRPSEIKDFDDTEMVLNYAVEAEFVFGTIAFDFSIGFEGDCSEIRAVMGIIAEYISVDYVDGEIVVGVTVPDKFGDILIKAINSDVLSDSLKHKIFAKISATGSDVEAFIAGLEFAEVIELLEAVDFESVLTSDFVSQYVDLSGLTNEEIIDKIDNYENYFNKAKDLVVRAMKEIPDSYMNMNLFDFYEGSGLFHAQKSVTVNIENVLSKITPKYAALIASFVDGNGDGTVTVSGELSVQFSNVNRVTYMLGDTVHLDGLLPVGADITYFANITEYNGYTISAWADKNGNVYTEMPDSDIVLYAYGALDVNVSGSVDATYDENEDYILNAEPIYVTANPAPTYTYEWFKDGVSLGTSANSSITVSSVADSGTYYCIVTVVDGTSTKTAKSEELTVNITKADPTYTVPDGLTAVFGDTLADVALPAGFAWQDALTTEVGNVGNNTFKVTFTPTDAVNYKTVTDIEVTIEVSAKDISNATVTLGPSLTYNGSVQEQTVVSVVLDGAYVTTYTLSNNTGKDAGSYTLTVTGTGNYCGTKDVTFTIAKADAEGAIITLGPSLTYNGSEQTQTVVSVTVNGVAAEFDVTGNVGTDANTYTLTVTLKGNHEGTATKEWTISKKNISGATVTLGVALTYNGAEQTQTVAGVTVDGMPVTYTVAGNTGKNADTYTLTVTANGNFEGTVTKNWTISKKTIDISSVRWDYDPVNNPFVYNGSAYTVLLVMPDGLDATYTENSAINAGEYTAEYTFVYDDANFELTGAAVSALVWEIEKASYDMSGITFVDSEVTYDGEEHSIFISGELPQGVTVTYEGNGKTEVGTYTVVAKFTVDDNHRAISDMSATLIIKSADPGPDVPGPGPDDPDYPLVKDFAVKDENGNIIVSVDAATGLPNGTEINAENKYDAFKNTDLSAILEDGKIGIIGNAYDITFTKDGEGYDVNSGSFTVRLIIPESLRAKEELIVIHIADSGEVSIMEGSQRDGDYMVFDTTHFSVYAVIAIEDAAAPFNWLPILIIILVLAIIIVLLIVFRRGGNSSGNSSAAPTDAPTDNTDKGEAPEEKTAPKNYDVVEGNAANTVAEEPIEEVTSEDDTAYEVVADEEAPAEEIPVEETPAETPTVVPVEETPYEIVPTEETPTVEAPVEEAPTEIPAEETPAEETPAEETPAEETPAEETPVEIIPIVVAPVTETAEETPTEDAPAEEAPKEEAPVEQTPAGTPDEIPAAIVTPVIVANEDDSIVVNGQVVYVRYRSSFASRLIQAEAPIQDYYTVIKNHILSYKGVKCRTSWNYELFNKGRTQCVKLNVKGKALTLELPLDPKAYNVNKYHFTDRSDSPKFEKLPMLMKVKSDRSLKYALELIDEVMKLVGIPKVNTPEVDYHQPYETNRELARRGLVKVILPAGVTIGEDTLVISADVSDHINGERTEKPDDTHVANSASDAVDETVADEAPTEVPVDEVPVDEVPVDETPTEAPADEAPVSETVIIDSISSDDTIVVGGDVVMVRYRSSFTSRFIQASEELQDYYTAIKNRLLSYKGVKSRTSWNYENFSRGRVLLARLNIKGKTLTLNLALATDGYNENKYHFTDVSGDPKFEKLPMLLKVRSARSLKYALELIDELVKNLEIPLGKPSEEIYRQAYEPNRELARRGLVKLILPKGVKIGDNTVLKELDVDTLFDKTKREDAPTENNSTEENPTQANVTDEAPVTVANEDTPTEEVPTEDVPTEDVPTETLIEDTPTEEAPAEEAPTEEAPAEEAPTEEAPAEEAPTEETPADAQDLIFTSADEADAIIEDSVAEEKIETVKEVRSGKMVEVNIGDICDNFDDGDVVTIAELKKKYLISSKAGRVKVLAGGTMTKSLTVVADKFSLQAVKMITLAGGTVKQYNNNTV